MSGLLLEYVFSEVRKDFFLFSVYIYIWNRFSVYIVVWREKKNRNEKERRLGTGGRRNRTHVPQNWGRKNDWSGVL